MRFIGILCGLVTATLVCHAGVFDFLKRTTTNDTSAPSSASLSGFSQEQLAQALKQALGVGIQSAVTNLGKPGGFLENPRVRIPMPERLQSVEKALRAMKQDRYADEFVATMNHAAEAAVPAALPIFTQALQSMTVEDARRLLSGGKDSATQFFKAKGETAVQEKLMPIVREATAKSGVTAAYKKLLDQAKTGGSSWLGLLNVNMESFDVDGYVTRKASDGLFTMVAEEEKRIRENPAARTTQLMRDVFGAVTGKK